MLVGGSAAGGGYGPVLSSGGYSRGFAQVTADANNFCRVLKDDETGYNYCCIADGGLPYDASYGFSRDSGLFLGRKSGTVLGYPVLTVIDQSCWKSVGDWQRIKRVPNAVGVAGMLNIFNGGTELSINGMAMPA
jgi:hypothetical protein